MNKRRDSHRELRLIEGRNALERKIGLIHMLGCSSVCRMEYSKSFCPEDVGGSTANVSDPSDSGFFR